MWGAGFKACIGGLGFRARGGHGFNLDGEKVDDINPTLPLTRNIP